MSTPTKKDWLNITANAAEELENMQADRSEFVIVYGRKRVGKTFLIDQYFKMNYDFSFVGSHRSTQRVQLRNFGKAMKQYAGLKTVPKYADWFDAYNSLEEHLSNLPAK